MKKRGLAIALLSVFTVSSFIVLFSLSAYNGTLCELSNMRKEIHTAPVIKVKFLDRQEKNIMNMYDKVLNDPDKILLIMARELTMDSFVDLKSAKQRSQGPLVPNRIVDSANLKRFVQSAPVKSAFIDDIILDSQFLKLNGKIVKFMPLPKNFLYGLNLPLSCGRLPNCSNEIVLTYRAAKLFSAGNIPNVIGKTIMGTDPMKSRPFENASFIDKYIVTGVLKKLPDAFYYSAFGELGGFSILPVNYVPLVERKNSTFVNNKVFFTTEKLFILPKKGENIVKQLKAFLQTFKLEGEGITPEISTEYKTLETVFSIDSVRHKLRYVILIGALVCLLAIFVAAVFTNLILELKRMEFAVKRAIGSRLKDVFNEIFAKYVVYIFISVFVSALLIVIFKGSLSEINTGSSIKFLIPVSFSLKSHTICLSWWVIMLSLLIMIAIFYISIKVPLRKLQVHPPFFVFLLKGKQHSHGNERIVVTIIAIAISVLLFSGSIKNYTQKKILGSEKIVSPNVIRIVSSETYLSGDKIVRFTIGAPRFSFDDYVALQKYLKGRAIVDFRNNIPTMDPETGIRYAEATPGALDVFGLKIKTGRFIEKRDLGQKVCVIGNTVANKYNFSCGKFIMLHVFNNQTNLYKVIGILGNSNYLINNSVFYAASSEGLTGEWNSSIKRYVGGGMFLIKPVNKTNAKNISDDSLKFLYERHPDKNKGTVIDVKKLIDKVKILFTSLYTLLSIFTFLALLSSFLSLSALLFIEVIRKTREIGIKKAIGATSREITKEFTLKGLKTTIIALLIGIPIGILISLIIEKLKGWSYYIPVNILILVILISLLLGLVFSFLPAYFASKTNPVEAIKSE